MNKKWEFYEENSEEIIDIAKKHNISELLTKILVNRGITDDKEIDTFLNPTRNDFYDPYLMPDMDKAVEFLREKGLATAQKKASRIAAEGIVMLKVAENGKKAVAVEVNAETDFVAKNEKFQSYVADVAAQALTTSAADIDAFLAEPWALDTTKTVNEALAAQIAVIGENMHIRRFAQVTEENGFVASYIHAGGRIGVLVVGNGEATDDVKTALTNVAMQVAAMNPQYVSRNDISADELAKIKVITLESALNDPFTLPKPILNALIEKAVADGWSAEDVAIYEEKKNDKSFNFNYLPNFLSQEAKAKLAELAVADKASISENKIFAGLVEGRVSKQLKDICLLDQVYVRAEDGKQTVAKYLESVDKALSIAKVVRFEVGEGIEKKEENFAEEVAKQMAGN